MPKIFIRHKNDLKREFEKYRIEQEQFGVVITPAIFVQIIFSDDVRFCVDHEKLLESFCEEDATQLIH
ncbi:hypothetical protein D3C75_333190 [compost metagenome]